jgi:hypothetical protein
MHGDKNVSEATMVIGAYIISIILAVAFGYIVRGLKDAICKEE